MKNKYSVIGIFAIVLIFAFLLYRSSETTVIRPPQNDTIVAFGDSLVQGVGASAGNDFVSLLSRKLNKPIINLGVSGNTTADGLSRINDVIEKKPGTVIVLFGGNDFIKKIPSQEIFANLRVIITTIQSSGANVILLGVRSGLLGDKYKGDFKSLAKETGSIYVPDVLSGLFGDSRYMSDTIHPNDAGYQRIADRVYEATKQYLK